MGAGVLSKSPFDLLPNSKFLQRLRETHWPAHVPMTSVYSRHDLVCPWWGSVLVPRPGETSLRNRPVSGVGHTALTYDPGVYLIVRRELEAAALSARTRAAVVPESVQRAV
jgi:hypothetical protein